MVTAKKFRNGLTFEQDGQVLQVKEFQHVKPGKGDPFVRTTVKNVITGDITDTKYDPEEKFNEAVIDRTPMQYSYNYDGLYYFLNPNTNDFDPIDESALDDNFRFVKEEMTCTVLSYKGKVFSVEPPNFVNLVVTETDPGFSGNTVNNTRKPAILETGAEVKVPLFIEPGELVKIDTRNGEYLSRAKAEGDK